MTAHLLSADRIVRELGTARVGRRVIVLDEIDSTNNYTFDVLAAREGAAADGAVVFAEHQSAGRGRLGRTWASPRGASLSFTVLLWEDRLPSSPVRLVMAGAVAVARGIALATDVEPEIRWPNDVYVKGRKLSGILVEAKQGATSRGGGAVCWVVAIGIGINCLQQSGHFSAELRDRATSLEMESRHPVDREAVARAVLRELDPLLRRDSTVSDESLSELWRERSTDIGARVTLRENGQAFCGVILDVNPASGLLLQLDTGGRRMFDPAVTSRE